MISHLPLRTLTRPSNYLRQLSTAQIPQHSIYVSESTNPYFNLSLEDWLFRRKPHNQPLLLIYRDEPCVVIGRNQNPWKEINMPLLRQTEVPFIRRRSGGGTVYHDLGNTNFSIHLPRSSFDRNESSQVVLQAVQSLGVDEASVNDRNDVCVAGLKISAYASPEGGLADTTSYVSGSAYKIVNKRAYHHGTMLISTQLGTLGKLLRSGKDTMITKGVASVPSPVCNLQQYQAYLSHDDFVNAVVREFQSHYNVDEQVYRVHEHSNLEGIEDIQQGASELSTWNWSFGQTPEFTYTLQEKFRWGDLGIKIHSKHGIILSCELLLTNPQSGSSEILHQLQEFSEKLRGEQYGFLDSSLASSPGPLRDVWNALNAAMAS